MTPPTARERKALEALQFEEWERKAKLGVGEKIFSDLVAKGWIAPLQGHDHFGDKIVITDLGRAALTMPKPVKVRSAPKLKELPSTRLKPLKGHFDPPQG